MRLALTILILATLLLAILVVVGRNYFANSPRPKDVGIGKIANCPSSPNCVSTQAAAEDHQIEPIQIKNSGAATLNELEKIISQMPKSRVITHSDEYLYIEFRSPFWNFIDDVEFFVNSDDGVIDSRSAARIGYSDGGVNRARYKRIIRLLKSSKSG